MHRALALAHTVTGSARIEDDAVIAGVKPRKGHRPRFTRDFEDWVACLAVRCTASAVTELARDQRRAIEVMTADGARWIKTLAKRRCPNARWVMGPFHAVQ